MYVPHVNAVDDEAQVRRMVADLGAGELVSVGADGFPVATLLPILWEADTIVAHMAKANQHWRGITDGSPVLVVCTGPQAYISPTWYASKAEHGRVVPTWNYSAVHLSGYARVHEDATWLRQAVDRLVTRHEGFRVHPWSTADAPERYVEGQLRAIVGIEVTVTRVEAKAKLSQNRSSADRDGVVQGLLGEPSPGAHAVAAQMAALPEQPPQ